MTAGLVSVVIPTFNRADRITRAIDSVLSQTYRNIEVVVVDDGSTDDTRDVVQSSYRNDSRVRYTYQPNAGPAAARNHGFAISHGDYIALLDSDDEFYPWKLAVQVACLERLPGVGMIWTDMDAVGEHGAVVAPRYIRTMYGAYKRLTQEEVFQNRRRLADIAAEVPDSLAGADVYVGEIYPAMFFGNRVHTSTVMMTRERLERVCGFNEDLKVSGEDYDFHLRTCREGPVAFLDAPSIAYQTGMADALTRPSLTVHIALNTLNTILPVVHEDRDRLKFPRQMINDRLAATYLLVGQSYKDLHDYRNARPYLLRSLRFQPARFRTWALLVFACLPHALQDWLTHLLQRPHASAAAH